MTKTPPNDDTELTYVERLVNVNRAYHARLHTTPHISPDDDDTELTYEERLVMENLELHVRLHNT
jgi:hypothetical protein